MNYRMIRCLAAPAAALSIAAAGTLAGAGAATAHVSASAPTLTQGGYGVVTLVVPNESESAATTTLTVTLPNLKSARPEVMSGWRATVTKDPSTEEVTSITWSALPDTPGVPVGEFAQFRISGGPFPEEDSVALPATQTYADGEEVSWSESMGADGAEPDHPAPMLTLPVADGDGDHHGMSSVQEETTDSAAAAESSTDDAARWLGGIGLIVGALGAVFGVAALTRAGRAAKSSGNGESGSDNA